MTPRTCREFALLIVSGHSGVPVPRAELAEHLARCPPCQAFDRQLTMASTAAVDACVGYCDELAADFEERLVERLCS